MLDRMPSVEANHGVYERHVDSYDRHRALEPAERTLLRRYRDRWPELSVLDIGVGAGRTAFTFAALAGRYVGIDYSQAMIDRARERIGEDETTRFLHCDARTMASELDGERFDLVCFSYNGIDSVGHEDRLAILAQARAVVAEDGRFFFSTHSLANLPFRAERPRMRLHRPIRSAYDAVHAVRRARRLQGRQPRRGRRARARLGADLRRRAQLRGALVLRPAGPGRRAATRRGLLGGGRLRRRGPPCGPRRSGHRALAALPLRAAGLTPSSARPGASCPLLTMRRCSARRAGSSDTDVMEQAAWNVRRQRSAWLWSRAWA